jgi:hypothetical protein
MAVLIHPGSATASLLAYAAINWPIPFVIPPGWSASWKHWDYLLKLYGTIRARIQIKNKQIIALKRAALRQNITSKP